MIEIECKECTIIITVENRRTKMCHECSHKKQLERCKKYKKNNKESVSEYNKIYKSEKKDIISDYNKKYNIDHREEIQKRQNIKHKERRETDENFKISEKLRKIFRKFLNVKTESKYSNFFGCNPSNFRKWIEYGFDQNMSWENYATYWQIDHVLCVNLFNMVNDEDQKICFNWRNTRPLKKEINLAREKIEKKDILNHEIKLHYFQKNNDGYDNIEYNFAYLTTKLLEKSN